MFFELSVLAAFGAMLCWGFGDFLIQKSTRKVGDIEALAFIGIIGSIILLPFVVFELPLLFSFENLALLCFVGIATLVIALFNFEALKQGKLSVVEIVFEIELPMAVLLGFLFFAEIVSAQQIALILFILLGIGLISLPNVSKKQFMKGFEKGIAMAIIGGIGLALLDFLTAAASRKVSPIMAVWAPAVVFTILCLVIIWRRKGFKKFAGNAAKYKFTFLG
ncbi:MAG: EamA family transporter, partial [Candidatus Diapherotrites archaeon]|nr:EamA family transporter [Candidatus Diapherotrites archaeon]